MISTSYCRPQFGWSPIDRRFKQLKDPSTTRDNYDAMGAFNLSRVGVFLGLGSIILQLFYGQIVPKFPVLHVSLSFSIPIKNLLSSMLTPNTPEPRNGSTTRESSLIVRFLMTIFRLYWTLGPGMSYSYLVFSRG